MDTIKLNVNRKPLMVAHRGSCSLELENTVPAFVAAGNRSYFGVECDLQKTADGKLIICHNPDTAYIAGDKLVIAETSFDTLRGLKLFNLPQAGKVKNRADLKMPTLSEYIAVCKQYEKVAVLEIKYDASEDEILEICRVIESFDYMDHVTFIAGNVQNLLYVRKHYPNQSAQVVAWKLTDELAATLIEHRLDLDVCYKDLTKEQIELLHQNGLKVNCWTVNDVETAERLIDWGIDLITTNILE
jgi:glycerophosphoryl diester phosphodiesterase